MENALSARVRSFTKGCDYDVCLSRDFLHAGDRVLFIDDFLANGNAALGMLELVGQAGASLAGMGFLIEKAFQPGGAMLREKGIRVESLARVWTAAGSYSPVRDRRFRFRRFPELSDQGRIFTSKLMSA